MTGLLLLFFPGETHSYNNIMDQGSNPLLQIYNMPEPNVRIILPTLDTLESYF